MLGRLKRRLRALLHKGAMEREMDEGLRYHLEREIEWNLGEGMNSEEARYAALRSFGGVEQAKEQCREARGVRLIEDLWKDLRYGARMLLKQPGFTLVAVVTLALGIGVNTAIFSVVNGVLLKSLPFPEPERLVVLSETSKDVPDMSVAFPNYLDWRAQQTVFENMAARMPAGGVLTGDGEAERITGRWVTASFFPTLGVRPQVGRFFSDEEDRPGAERVIVLNNGLWQRRFGGDPQVVGRVLQYNSERWTIIGVMPAAFDFYGQYNLNNDFFIPLGRLADQEFMRDRSSHPVEVTLLSTVGLYGVLSYVVTQRTREIGIRIALGARTRDVLNLVIKYGMTLALTGVAVGLVVAFALTRLMQSLLFKVSATDPLTFVLITLLLLAVALLACYLPARRAAKVDPLIALRHE
ncbi:MAG: ABC transporter permease [Acidobacteria bacterium]|nr:ABC transporter permease [Acidobacteriota bacterium]